MVKSEAYYHNKAAPFWTASLLILCVTGLSTIWFDLGDFWRGYVLDITGPAWNYMLFRGLFTGYKNTPWTQFFTPVKTLVLFVMVSYGIETAQYLKLYESTFDPWDLGAYVLLLIPVFCIDYLRIKYVEKIMKVAHSA